MTSAPLLIAGAQAEFPIELVKIPKPFVDLTGDGPTVPVRRGR
jgi:hypothetical protein